MAEIRVLEEACVGCRKCVPACPYAAISMLDKKARISEACVFCGVCVDVCGYDAIHLDLGQLYVDGPDEANGIWVLVEHVAGRVRPVSWELLGEGSRLAQASGEQLSAVYLGAEEEADLSQLFGYGADRVIAVLDPRLSERNEQLYPEILAQVVQRFHPAVLLIGATGFGRSVAPRLASRLNTGLTADCTQLSIDPESGLLLQTRPAFGGNLMATITCRQRRPQMASVRPRVMQALPFDRSRSGEILFPELAFPVLRQVEILETLLSSGGKQSLEDADLVIGIGRGIGHPRNIAKVEELAQRLGAGVGASRAVVDLGWMPYTNQVGQTGTSIAPKVYLALGISGAVQHIAGLSASTYVIAVNKDPNAPIFQAADEGYVGDCMEIVDALLKARESTRAPA